MSNQRLDNVNGGHVKSLWKSAWALLTAALLLMCGCSERRATPNQRAQPAGETSQTGPCVVENGRVVSINGTRINFPDSEKLNWIAPMDSKGVDPKLVALGHAKLDAATAERHALIVQRYAIIGDYVLLCAWFDPPIPDGSFNWVVNTKEMKYVGDFLDKDSR